MPQPPERRFDPHTLDALNFLLADVRGALGPYLNVFLVTRMQWSQSAVGIVTTVSGLLALVVQTPAGMLIDRTHAKRGLIVGALALLALAACVLVLWPSFWPVLAANTVIAMVGDIFGPAIAALTLGIFGRGDLTRRLGRNAAFDHAGNVAIAIAAGVTGWLFSQRAVFLLVPVFAVLAMGATLLIPAQAINHRRARGGRAEEDAVSGLRSMVACRPLLAFGFCNVLFHLANAPLLPLVGQKLALSHPEAATAMMSSCIIAAQAIMLPISVAVGHTADRFGRKPILLIAFAVLPIRGILYTVSDNAAWLVGVQLLDGVGAGILGALMPLVVADLMRGTGRFNAAQGAIATMQGIGASLSGIAAGVIVDHMGYDAAFLAAAGVAVLAFLWLLLTLPETASIESQDGFT